jgi:hypothetical protein
LPLNLAIFTRFLWKFGHFLSKENDFPSKFIRFPSKENDFPSNTFRFSSKAFQFPPPDGSIGKPRLPNGNFCRHRQIFAGWESFNDAAF